MTHKLEKLIDKLIELNIRIELEGERDLRVSSEKDISEIPSGLLNELKAQKPALIDYFLSRRIGNAQQDSERIPRAPQKGSYVLSSAQKRLYFLQSLSPESTSYNMLYYHTFNEKLDRERLERSLQKLADRHEILRTRFTEEQGVIVQSIETEISFSTQFFECTTIEEVDEIIKQNTRAFDLSQAPLFRSLLIRIKDRYLWIIDIHHIISDGTSQGILIADLLRFYQGLELPVPPLSYKDYSEWQNIQIESGALKKQEDYWIGKLGGELPVLNFPADRLRPAVFTFKGARYDFVIDKDRTARLKAMGDRHKGTLQMSLMAILKVLLYKYTKQEDIIVGCGISGRPYSELQGMAGLFVNMLAIRTEPSGSKTFMEFYREVIAASLEAYENQEVQFDDLVDRLKLNRDLARNPIFDVALVVQNFERTEMEGGYDIVTASAQDLIVDPRLKHDTSKFDLTFIVNESDAGIEILLEYYTELFTRSTVKRIAEHFTNIIDQVLMQEELLLSGIDMISDGEKKKILQEFNRTAVSYPEGRSIHSLILEQASRYPEKIAVADENGSYTYAELENQSGNLAVFLKQKLGIAREACVGILQARDRKIVPSILGTLRSGAAYLNLDPRLPEERLLYMIRDSNLKYLLTEKGLVGLASKLQWRSELEHIICIDSADIYSEHGGLTNELMRKELWDYVGDSAVDAITAGGWLSSYTGEPISAAEMQEYSDNAYLKIKKLLHKDMKVLEIGCSSGLTMFQVAPEVGSYYGTDLSSSILNYAEQLALKNGHRNIHLTCMPADQIETLGEKDFDLIIMNSVIQCFEDHNYLRDVLKKAVGLLKAEGMIFVGDIMDEAERQNLEEELKAFKAADTELRFKTKTDWSSELFVSKKYFQDLVADNLGMVAVDFSAKIHTIRNELTKFRYDTFITVDKHKKRRAGKKNKKQWDLSHIQCSKVAELSEEGFSAHDLCYVVYTSGSTGKPKGVLIEHHSLVNLCFWQKRYLGLDYNSISTQCADTGFDAFVFEVFPLLVSGGRLEIIPESRKLSVQHLVPFFHEKKISHTFLPTPLYHEIVSTGLNAELPGMTVWVGGDRLKYGPGKNIVLHNCYGPTESTVCVTAMNISPEQNGLPLIGKAIDNSRVYILDEDKLQPIGVPGEICLSGAGLARGYMNKSGLSNEKFLDSPLQEGERLYRTGDLGRYLEDGNIEFIGRKDEQVKVRGYRIEPGEIEHVLLKHEQIEEAIVIARNNPEGEAELVAYIRAKTTQKTGELRSFLKAALPDYMIPSAFVQLSVFPLNSSGKIDKRSLPDPENTALGSGADHVPPGNELEARLVSIWERLLQKKGIGIKDDFFSLGGHSLKVVRLSNEYGRELSVKLPLKDLFIYTTIQAQAELIRSAKKEQFIQIEPLAPMENYPISDAQRRLWVLSQLEGGSVAYNTPASIYLADVDSPDHFKKAIASVTERHEILRTVFKADESGEIRQWVLSKEDFRFEIAYKDLRKHKDKREQVQLYINTDAYKPFDLEAGPLLRAALLRTEEKGYVFYFNMHHIISDGWSMQVLAKDVFSYYNAYKMQTLPALEPLRIHYKDYSAWQLSMLADDTFRAHGDYWLSALGGKLPLLDLPGAKKRPRIRTNNGRTLGTYLSKTLSRKLKAFSQQQGGTLFMGLLASLHAIMYRYTGNTGMVIGSPVAGREHADLENQIGFYVNTLALRNEIDPEDSFRTLFSSVRRTTLEAYSHQMYPFDRLVEELQLVRDTSRSAVFDVMLVLQNNGENTGNPDLKDSELERVVDRGYKTSKFDMLISAMEQGDYLDISIEYNTDIYERELMERFIVHYRSLLSEMLAAPEQKLGTLNYLSEGERQQLLVTFNSTQVNYGPGTVIELFERQVAKTPEQTALEFGQSRMSYKELHEQSNQLAGVLRERYAVSGKDRVGVMLERSLESVVAMIGVMKTGACYVPIDHAYPADRISYIVNDAAPAVIVSTENLYSRHKPDVAFFDIKELGKAQQEKINPGAIIQPEDGAYVIYTSGSTGRPKGVVQTHRMMSNLIYWDIHHSGIRTGLKHLQYASFSFDASLHDLYFVLSSGGCASIVRESSRLDYMALKQEILEKNIEVISMPYSALNAFCTEIAISGLEGHVIRYIVSTAEQLFVNKELRNFLEKHPQVELHNHYGPSETHVVTSFKMSEAAGTIVNRAPIGSPISNSRVYILDQHKHLVPVGVEGELYIGGDNLANGYLNKEALTHERFVEDPFRSGELVYKTGDRGYWRQDGNIEFCGRQDDQLKIRGYRVEPGEIEYALKSYAEIEEAVVIARENSEHEKELVAYITAQKTQEAGTLRHHLKTLLPEYMFPACYVQLEAFPLTPNGKIDKNALPDPLEFGITAGSEYQAPGTETEKKLVALWQDILQRTPIGIKDDFFVLGGHSLKAVRLSMAVNKMFNVRLDIGSFFQNPTVELLAKEIERVRWLSEEKETSGSATIIEI